MAKPVAAGAKHFHLQSGQPPRRLAQHLVGAFIAQAGMDRLETVDIDQCEQRTGQVGAQPIQRLPPFRIRAMRLPSPVNSSWVSARISFSLRWVIRPAGPDNRTAHLPAR